jgi:prolyl 4-hydroxylase
MQNAEAKQKGQILSSDPFVCVFDNYVSALEVEHILAAGATLLAPALVTGPNEGVISTTRTGRNCWIAHRHDKVIAGICERISELAGLPLENAESLQLIHYDHSEEYAPHFDGWDADSEDGQRCMSRGGQRLVTGLLYLNDVPAGGGTSFPNLQMEVQARKGRLLLFHNCLLGGIVRHPNSLHGGMPVLEGEKWACNLWFRERVFS